MSDIKSLLARAKSEINEAYSECADIRLEEFDKSSSKIILSFLVPDKNPAQGFASLSLGNRNFERIYKTIEFDENGEVESVKIYER